MAIPKSTAYAAVQEGVIRAKGSKRDMAKWVKQSGGSLAGWRLWVTDQPVGAILDNPNVNSYWNLRDARS